MTTTKIEWADAVWNPVTGCTKVSEGCKYCYAETMAKRFWGERKFTEVRCHEERLTKPFHWKKPKRVFVNSMSDLFHKDVPDHFIGLVFAVMALSPQHTFMILTKRPDRMKELLTNLGGEFFATITVNLARQGIYIDDDKSIMPLKNVWLGVSVENQESADKRIPLLMETPSAVRFVSCEPLLGAVNLWDFLPTFEPGIDWVICGGESGRFARPVHPDWVRSLRNQCVNVGMPFFFKQWGEWEITNEVKFDDESKQRLTSINVPGAIGYNKAWFQRVGKRKAGRVLDGRTWDEFPEERE